VRTPSSAYDQACSLQFGLSTRDATQGQDLFGALQSSDWKEAIAEIQDVHLHTKARMGDIPIVAVGGGVDGRWLLRIGNWKLNLKVHEM